MVNKSDSDRPIVITDSMAKQEAEYERAAEKQQAKPNKQTREIDNQEESARVARLKFLIEKSKIYTSILSEKLLKQQEKSKKTGEEIDSKKENKKGSYDISKYVNAEDLKEKANGDSTTTALNKAARSSGRSRLVSRKLEENKENNPGANGKEEHAPEGVSNIAKPSASARQPELVTGGVLRDYQLAGVEWMVSLYENGLNGILADEMGLGKTLQTISFLAFLRSKGVHGPFLIAAPLSTIANWVNEVRRFTPDIPVVLYHGSKDERGQIRNEKLGKVDKNFPIVVTSYEIIMNDRKYLQKYSWKYIVVDEGHRLKNLNCKLIRELKTYTSANRLLLTGTPLQNNLSELWSLLNFLLPDIFSDLESFQSWFDFSSLNGDGKLVDEEQQSSVVSSLHLILKPFLLRRLKTDVETDLPSKREYLLYAPMTAGQTDLYKAILNKNVGEYCDSAKKQPNGSKAANGKGHKKRKSEFIDLSSDVETNGTPKKRKRKEQSMKEMDDNEWFAAMEAQENGTAGQEEAAVTPSKKNSSTTSHLKLRNMLMSLRKACNHPYQMDWPVYPKTDEYVVDKNMVNLSGKMLLLERLLTALFKEGHKVLIFSQFTSMLDIIEVWAEDIKRLIVCRIDGTVSQEDRRERIAHFNTRDDHKLFLLSTRAGGLGINLTSADTVILFDSDWNPQVDLQAMDRVHRIGQTKPVIVYRLVSANTIETKILEKASNKRRLEKVVIQKDKFKSVISGASTSKQESMAVLSEILMQEDAESIQVKSEQDEIISDADLAKIMDRSASAYEQQEQSAEGGVFRSVITARDAENDALAT